ncbi:PadR family transcriptional regulator [Nocardia sp. NBC_00508]|uniref:PadR family transcriptional regulator n=1 Tax=Nocardia sp. NBC_00508 TaxID=2975992 RepID=UPI002E815ECC|nr:PadR family transcriptional regulator [Nocardia sp. NBC_00508]WUD64299.1 PadR family transcriptional regulator [Nocardia sp. NBC_00508]
MGQAPVTPLAIAVLALLEERPMHPYEMYQTLISRREDKLVKVRPGSLYHTVSRLADQELVRAEGVDRAGNRPERTTYRITTRGRDALRNRIAEIVRQPIPEYPVFPVALGELHNLPKPEVLALLRERIGELEIELADSDMLITWAEQRAVPRRYWIALPFTRAMLAAEAAWVKEFVAELDSGALEWEDFDPETGARSEPSGARPAVASTARPPAPDGAVANSVTSFSDDPS